jgi:O-antigen/teichoic acid export membrane protein
MSPSGRAPGTALPFRTLPAWRAVQALRARSNMVAALFGPFARKVMGLSALTALGQASFVIALPALSRLYAPSDFGLFTIYLSIVNIGGPIVGLKFESALYAARTKQEASITLALSVLTITIMSGVAAVALFMFSRQLTGTLGPAARWMVWYLPFGLLLAGMWSASSAWAVKSEAISTLGIARLVQPAAMTGMQLVAGLTMPASGIILIGAHLISHIAYSTFVFSRTLTWNDLSTLVANRWTVVLQHARAQSNFPLYVLPAQISFLAVSNLPPLLLSLFYGAEIAGYSGVAYRLVAAPLAVASLPLGAIFTSVISQLPRGTVVVSLARRVFLASLFLVAVPILLLGAAAPAFAPAVLGDRWLATGQIISAFALIGAAQSLAVPFMEVTSIFRSQALRFVIEFVPAVLVIGSVLLGGLYGWLPLKTIWLMSIAGAGSSLAGLALLWGRLPAMVESAIRYRAAEEALRQPSEGSVTPT